MVGMLSKRFEQLSGISLDLLFTGRRDFGAELFPYEIWWDQYMIGIIGIEVGPSIDCLMVAMVMLICCHGNHNSSVSFWHPPLKDAFHCFFDLYQHWCRNFHISLARCQWQRASPGSINSFVTSQITGVTPEGVIEGEFLQFHWWEQEVIWMAGLHLQYKRNTSYSLIIDWQQLMKSMKLLFSPHFISWKNSFSDISRRCILPNMAKSGTALITFGKMHFLVISEN